MGTAFYIKRSIDVGKNGGYFRVQFFRMRELRPSGPAALPGLNLDSCFAAPLTDMVISGMVGKLRDLGRISSRS